MKMLSSYLEMCGGLDGEEGVGRKDGDGGGGVHANQTKLNLRVYGMGVHGEGRGDKQLCLFHLAGIRGSAPQSSSPPALSDANRIFAGSARFKDNPLGGGVKVGLGGRPTLMPPSARSDPPGKVSGRSRNASGSRDPGP